MKSLLKFSFFIMMFGFVLTSCNKEFDKDELYDYEITTRDGEEKCFELFYPVIFEFEDGTTVEVNSLEEIKALYAKDKKNKPSLVFPVYILTPEDEELELTSKMQLERLKRQCRKGDFDSKERCFRAQYPLTINFPDGTSVTVDTRRNERKALKEWRKNNKENEEKPSRAYPFDVRLKDGTIMTINNLEELMKIYEECKG